MAGFRGRAPLTGAGTGYGSVGAGPGGDARLARALGLVGLRESVRAEFGRVLAIEPAGGDG